MLDAILLKQMTHILFNYWSYSLKFYSTFLLTLILYFVNLKRRDVVKQFYILGYSRKVSFHPIYTSKKYGQGITYFGTMLAKFRHSSSNYPRLNASVSNKVMLQLLGVPRLPRGDSLCCFYKNGGL